MMALYEEIFGEGGEGGTVYTGGGSGGSGGSAGARGGSGGARNPCPPGKAPVFRGGRFHCDPKKPGKPPNPPVIDRTPKPTLGPRGDPEGEPTPTPAPPREVTFEECQAKGMSWHKYGNEPAECHPPTPQGGGGGGGGGQVHGPSPERTPTPPPSWKPPDPPSTAVPPTMPAAPPTPTGAELAKEIRGQLPSFQADVGQPDPFRPPSVADVLANPNYQLAERNLLDRMRGQAAATGTRGAPYLAAQARGQQQLLGGMMDQLYGQQLGSWQAGMQHGQDTHNRNQSAWQRAAQPTQFAYQQALGQGQLGLGHGQLGLGYGQLGLQRELGQGDLGLRQQYLDWTKYWQPMQQQRQFGQQRWLTGQNNALSMYMALMGLRPAGLEQRY